MPGANAGSVNRNRAFYTDTAVGENGEREGGKGGLLHSSKEYAHVASTQNETLEVDVSDDEDEGDE